MDAEKMILQMLAYGVCSSTNCEECNKLFGREDCPRDEIDREEMLSFVTNMVQKIKDRKYYDLGRELSMSEDEILDFLLNEK